MSRFTTFKLGIVLALVILLIRLVHLQLIQGSFYLRLAEKNRLRLVPEQAPRGIIVDRYGHLLAGNQTLLRVAVIPQEVSDLSFMLKQVGQVIGRSEDTLRETYRKERSLPFLPAPLISHIPKETALRLEEERWRLPGLLIQPQVVRHYPLGGVASHLLGYLSQPTAEELSGLKAYGVSTRDWVGRAGLEQWLERDLHGRSGGLVVEVDNRARQVRVIDQMPPRAGRHVRLTIDVALQALIEQAFGDQPGAGVILNPQNGEILAMVSVPTFSPEAFILRESHTIQQFLDDVRSPLMNRATMGVYMPGSILKLISAVTALEHRIITPSTVIECRGAITIGDRTFHCWNRDGHGPLSLSEAIMHSCNVYFLQVGRRLGTDALLAMLEQVGCSHRTGWPMGEATGHLPSRRLTEGELAMLAIGQGEILLTPVQAAVIAAVFANGGWLVKPQIIDAIDGRSLVSPGPIRRLGWSSHTIEAIRVGMMAAVSHPSGTAHRAFLSNVSIAGKTGTAQTHVPGQTHGWFVGFCPAQSPQVAMAIVAEHGGSGGDLPTAIASIVCNYITQQASRGVPEQTAL